MALPPPKLDFIAISCIRAPLKDVLDALHEWDEWRDAPKPLKRGDAPTSPIRPAPQQHTVKPMELQLWEPRTAPCTTIFHANFMDGWSGVVKTLGTRTGMECVTVRTSARTSRSTVCEVVLVQDREVRRSVCTGKFDDRWEFFQSGQALPFEHVDRYGRRLVRDRFDAQAVVDFLAALGWNFDNPAIWEHDGLSASLVHDWEGPA